MNKSMQGNDMLMPRERKRSLSRKAVYIKKTVTRRRSSVL